MSLPRFSPKCDNVVSWETFGLLWKQKRGVSCSVRSAPAFSKPTKRGIPFEARHFPNQHFHCDRTNLKKPHVSHRMFPQSSLQFMSTIATQSTRPRMDDLIGQAAPLGDHFGGGFLGHAGQPGVDSISADGQPGRSYGRLTFFVLASILRENRGLNVSRKLIQSAYQASMARRFLENIVGTFLPDPPTLTSNHA